jgi:hypothetical protein
MNLRGHQYESFYADQLRSPLEDEGLSLTECRILSLDEPVVAHY